MSVIALVLVGAISGSLVGMGLIKTKIGRALNEELEKAFKYFIELLQFVVNVVIRIIKKCFKWIKNLSILQSFLL